MAKSVSLEPLMEDYDEDASTAKYTPPSWLIIHNQHLRECLAEFFGTFVMIAFGVGVNNETSLNGGKNGGWVEVTIGWGIGVMFGVHAAGGVSGAHLNPSVTVAMAWFGQLPWRKVPGYVVSQLLGAFAAALCIYVMYKPLYAIADPGRLKAFGNFATSPAAHIPNATAFFTEAFATAMVVACLFMFGDQQNRPASETGAPVHVMLLIWGIGMSFGSNSGYALNPARDFGPRLAASICGWGSKVFSHRDYYFWIPLVAPVIGGIVGGYAYSLFVKMHHPRTAIHPAH